jgi:hypothetical protein
VGTGAGEQEGVQNEHWQDGGHLNPRPLYSEKGAIKELGARERKIQAWNVFRTVLLVVSVVNSLKHIEPRVP